MWLFRSQAQLQKLGEQLDLDVGGGNEDDPKTKASSDDVNGGFTSPLNEGQLNSSPRKKKSRVSLETPEASHQGIKLYAYIRCCLLYTRISLS